MTEAEWDGAETAIPLWAHTRGHPRWTSRTLRLFVAAFWGWQARRLDPDRGAELAKRVAATERWAGTGSLPPPYRARDVEGVIFFRESPTGAAASTVRAPNSAWTSGWEECTAVMPLFLRDVFGNPFRPVTADPAWFTSTVVQLAGGVYEERAFDRLPILADALQDAGCENDDVLTHCRGLVGTRAPFTAATPRRAP